MLVPELLLETMDDLTDEEFEKLKWFLHMKIFDTCKPIAKARLQKKSRFETVSVMIDSYGEESAVNVTVEILKKINQNSAADKLKREHTAAISSSAVAPPSAAAAAPGVTMSANAGAVIFAPTITGCTSGQMNFSINKYTHEDIESG